MDEDLFPDLANFEQSGLASFDFPLDPSLGGPVASTSRLGGGGSSDEDLWDEGDDSVNEDEYDDDESETDAEDEYRAAAEGGVKRKGAPLGGTFEGIENGKGKGREVYPGEEGEDDGELGWVLGTLPSRRGAHSCSPDGSSMRSATRPRRPLAGALPLTRSLTGRSKKRWRISTALVRARKAPRARAARRRSCVCLLLRSRRAQLTMSLQGRRAVAELEPSSEVKGLLGMANRHYAMGEHDQAEEHLKQVITIDAAIRAPWYTLASIYEERGDKEKALMFKIVATHLASAKAAAPEWAELGAQSRCAVASSSVRSRCLTQS